MKRPLTDRLLLLIADFADLHRVAFSVPRAQAAISGDPRWRRDRRWLEERLRRSKGRRWCHNALYALATAGFLRRVAAGRYRGYLMTAKGEQRVFCTRAVCTLRRKLPHRRWLMVFFDIPERMRRERDYTRRFLQALGFASLQKSIWVTTYDATAAVREFIRRRRLRRYVKLLVVQEQRL